MKRRKYFISIQGLPTAAGNLILKVGYTDNPKSFACKNHF